VQVWSNGHSAPLYMTIGKALNHGDDDYMFWPTTPPWPISAILIPYSTFYDWMIGPNSAPDDNISRQLAAVDLKYLPDKLLTDYCTDKAANVDHASGQVYYFFRLPYSVGHYYTVAELEAQNLWGRLGLKAAALGYCN